MRYYNLGKTRDGKEKRLYYAESATFACPHLPQGERRDWDDEQWSALDKHESAETRSWRRELMTRDEFVETLSDGTKRTTLVQVTERFRVTKNGRRPVCKCGEPMQFLGWRVWRVDEDHADIRQTAGFRIRDANNDKHHWVRFAKTLKTRDKIIQTELNKNRK